MTQNTNEHDEEAEQAERDKAGDEDWEELLANAEFKAWLKEQGKQAKQEHQEGKAIPGGFDGIGEATSELSLALEVIERATRAGMTEQCQKIITAGIYEALSTAVLLELKDEEEIIELPEPANDIRRQVEEAMSNAKPAGPGLMDMAGFLTRDEEDEAGVITEDTMHAALLKSLQESLEELTFEELAVAATMLGFDITITGTSAPQGERGTITLAWKDEEGDTEQRKTVKQGLAEMLELSQETGTYDIAIPEDWERLDYEELQRKSKAIYEAGIASGKAEIALTLALDVEEANDNQGQNLAINVEAVRNASAALQRMAQAVEDGTGDGEGLGEAGEGKD